MVLVSGAVSVTPLALTVSFLLGPDALFLGWTLGAAYGAVVGAAALSLRRAAHRRLNRTN